MEKLRIEKMQVREEVGKSRNTVFSIVAWLQMRDEKLHAIVVQITF